MPPHSKQTVYDVFHDSRKLAKAYVADGVWPRVYAKLAREHTTHSAQSWRNWHNRNKPLIEGHINRYRARRAKQPADRSDSTSDEEKEGTSGSEKSEDGTRPTAAPGPSRNAQPAAVPKRGSSNSEQRKRVQPKRYVPPDVHDFGTSSSSDGESEQEVDELRSSPNLTQRPSAKARGKQRAVGSQKGPSSPPRARMARNVPWSPPARRQMPADQPTLGLGSAPRQSKASSLNPAVPPTSAEALGKRAADFLSPREPERAYPSKRRRTEPVIPTRDESPAPPAAGPSRHSMPEPPRSESPIMEITRFADGRETCKVFKVDAQVAFDDGVRPQRVYSVHARPSPQNGSGPSPRVTTSNVADSDSEEELGAGTQLLANRFYAGFRGRARSSSHQSHSSDLIREAMIPQRKPAPTSPLKEVTGAQAEKTDEDDDEETLDPAAQALVNRYMPPKKTASPRRLRSHGFAAATADLEESTQGETQDSGATQEAETQEPPIAIRKAPRAPPVPSGTPERVLGSLSRSDRRALLAIVQWGASRSFLSTEAFEAYFACSGDSKVLDALALSPSERTPAHERMIEQGRWSAEEDRVIISGPPEEQARLEQKHGQNSVEYRREFLEALGHGSRETW